MAVAGFAHHLQAGPGVLRAFRFVDMASPHLFLRAAAQGVVAVFGPGVFRVALNSDLADAVFVIVAEALRHSPVRDVAHGHAPETVVATQRLTVLLSRGGGCAAGVYTTDYLAR